MKLHENSSVFRICVQNLVFREKSWVQIYFLALASKTPVAEFQLSHLLHFPQSVGVDTNCGTASTTAYANAGSYDHVVIPGGQCAPATGGATNLLNDKYCGTQLNCLTAAPAVTTAATAGTVCTNQRPFKISVKSDDREYHNPTASSEAVTGNNVGFSLSNYFSQYF